MPKSREVALDLVIRCVKVSFNFTVALLPVPFCPSEQTSWCSVRTGGVWPSSLPAAVLRCICCPAQSSARWWRRWSSVALHTWTLILNSSTGQRSVHFYFICVLFFFNLTCEIGSFGMVEFSTYWQYADKNDCLLQNNKGTIRVF